MRWHFNCEITKHVQLGTRRRLLAETIREVGVLILVFAPLEAAFAETAPGTLFLSIMLVLGVGLIVSGILVGARN